jgi:hypothetical protein
MLCPTLELVWSNHILRIGGSGGLVSSLLGEGLIGPHWHVNFPMVRLTSQPLGKEDQMGFMLSFWLLVGGSWVQNIVMGVGLATVNVH